MRYIVLAVLVVFLSLTADNAYAGIYKWVDKDGTVHYADSPPPSGTDAEEVNPQPNRVEGYGKVSSGKTSGQNAAKTKQEPVPANDLPIVEIFVTSWCGYCKKAEAYFTRRNIPFVKYDIEKDQAAARRKASLTQSRGVPFVLIGDVGIPGYSESAFERALRQYR